MTVATHSTLFYDGPRHYADEVGEAEEALASFGPRAEPIRALGRFILERKA